MRALAGAPIPRRSGVDEPALVLIDSHSLTPDWDGEPLTADALGIIADCYARRRRPEIAGADPWVQVA